MVGKGPDRRYPEMVLEPLGSNNPQARSDSGRSMFVTEVQSYETSRENDLKMAMGEMVNVWQQAQR